MEGGKEDSLWASTAETEATKARAMEERILDGIKGDEKEVKRARQTSGWEGRESQTPRKTRS